MRNFLCLCSSKTKEKRKKEDSCDLRNMAPTVESNEEWLAYGGPREYAALCVQTLSGRIQAESRCVWYCQTASHDTRHAGKTMSTLLWLLLLLQVLYIVEIPVFRMSKHLTASYPALFTSLKGILLGHLSTNVQESLLLFFFFTFIVFISHNLVP